MQLLQMGRRVSLRPACGVILLCAISTLGLAVSSGFAAGDERGVGVVFGPGVSAEEALRRVLVAGAMPMSSGATPNVAIARVDGPATVAALYRVGAWIVVGGMVAPACASPMASTPAGNRSPS
jgi:hypothetical protein